MKRLLSYGLIAAVLSLASCRESETVYIYPPAPMNNAEDFVNKFGPQKQTFTLLTSELPKTISLNNGSKITIPQTAIQKNGNYVSGNITVEALEILKRSDVILAGINTNHLDGFLIDINGILQVEVLTGGKYVDHEMTNVMNVTIPSAQNGGHVKISNGDLNATGTGFTAWGPDMVDVFSDANEVAFNTLSMGWLNSGTFYGLDLPAGSLAVTLNNNPGELATSRGRQGYTFVYFCPKNSKVAMQLHITAGADKVKSIDNVIPIGVEGKVMAFSIKDRKFYFAERDITTSHTNNVSLDLSELAVDVLLNNIRGLDVY
jgi:hypothetical protein